VPENEASLRGHAQGFFGIAFYIGVGVTAINENEITFSSPWSVIEFFAIPK